MNRWCLRILALYLAVMALAQQAGLRHARLNAIASGRVLNHVNRDDASAALKAWFDLLAQKKGFSLDSRVDIVNSLAEIRERLQNHSVDILMMGANEYFELEGSHLVVPVLTDTRGSRPAGAHAYLLLVSPSSTAASVAELRGKNLLVYSRSTENTGLAWLDVLVSKEKLGRAASFFASVKPVEKPQSSVLPLFFGAVDACVVDDVDWDLAREMNPQLGGLRVLARSRPVIDSILAMPTQPHPYQKELIETMLTLHEEPRGRQMLMVFRADRLVPVQPADLDASRDLWREHSRLAGSPPSHGATPGTDRGY